jgi:hypothetical protein
MTFEEQLIRETWLKESTPHRPIFWVPSKGSHPQSRGEIPLRGRAVTPQVLLGVFTQDYTIEPIITCGLV